jgi:HlyD family secretion protein
VRRRARGWIVGVIAFAAAGAGAVVLVGRGGGAAEVPTHRVESQSFRREVPAEGNLKAVEATPISAPQGARMPLKVAWMVEDGTRVAKGDVVVRFDPSEMRDHLREGTDSTTQAKRRITKERATSGSALRRRDREAQVAEREMGAAREFESVDEDVFSRNEIIESQIDLELAGARMAHAQAAKQIERSVSSGKLDVLRVQERQAALVVSRAEEGLSNLELVAPHSGIVLLHRDWRGRAMTVGDTVWPGQKLAEIPGDEAMEAEVYVLEADGGSLEVGMKGALVIESQPGKTYAAAIKRVDTLAKPRVAEVPVQYFAVILSLERANGEVMKIGQRVRARILLEEIEALVVPRQAVFSEGGKSFVHRRAADGFEKVAVELGPGTAGRVVVTSGLAEGDDIALRAPSNGRATGAAKEHDARR